MAFVTSSEQIKRRAVEVLMPDVQRDRHKALEKAGRVRTMFTFILARHLAIEQLFSRRLLRPLTVPRNDADGLQLLWPCTGGRLATRTAGTPPGAATRRLIPNPMDVRKTRPARRPLRTCRALVLCN